MLPVSNKTAAVPHHCLLFGSDVLYKATKKINHFCTNRKNPNPLFARAEISLEA